VKINRLTVPEEIDVCDFLNRNPSVKAAIEAVIEECVKEEAREPIEELDVVRATIPLPIVAGNLLDAAGHTHYDDWVETREKLHREALRLAALALLYYAKIGSLKSEGQQEEV